MGAFVFQEFATNSEAETTLNTITKELKISKESNIKGRKLRIFNYHVHHCFFLFKGFEFYRFLSFPKIIATSHFKRKEHHKPSNTS
jgi:hypothetical protein